MKISLVIKRHTPFLNTDEDFRLKKKEARGDPGDVENYKGPWANYVDINLVAKPTEVFYEIIEFYK